MWFKQRRARRVEKVRHQLERLSEVLNRLLATDRANPTRSDYLLACLLRGRF